MKKLTMFLAAVFCIFLLGGCGGKANWSGAFYMEVDEYNTIVFDIETGEEYISFTRIDINTYGGGTAKSSVTGSAEITKGNTAENATFRFTLSGDTLTVKALTADEYYVAYEGKYTRGEPVPTADETNDEGDDDSGDNEEEASDSIVISGSIVTNSFYYRDGDSNWDSMYFYYDGTCDLYSTTSEALEGRWDADEDTLTISVDGDMTEYTVEDGGRVIVTPDGERFMLEDTYSESDDSGGGEANAGIVTSSYYYWDGDEDSNSLYFYDDNTVDFDVPGEDTVEGIYSIDGDTLTITWDTGDEIILTIEDGGITVVSAQDEYYHLEIY